MEITDVSLGKLETFLKELYFFQSDKNYEKGISTRFLKLKSNDDLPGRIAELSKMEITSRVYYCSKSGDIHTEDFYKWKDNTENILDLLKHFGIVERYPCHRGEFEILGLDTYRLAILYFLLPERPISTDIFIYPRIVIDRIFRVIEALNIDITRYLELTDSNTIKSKNICFELFINNADRNNARVFFSNLIKNIQKNYILDISKFGGMKDELASLEKEIDNEIIELIFGNFRYYYNSSTKQGSYTLKHRDIQSLMDEVIKGSSKQEKDPFSIKEQYKKNENYAKKESNNTIASLYAVLSYAQEIGVYKNGSNFTLEIPKDVFVERCISCHYFKKKPSFSGNEDTITLRFASCRRTLQKIGADFDVLGVHRNEDRENIHVEFIISG